MKTVKSFKVLGTTRPSTNLQNPEDPKSQHRHCENLKYIVLKLSMTNYFDRDKLPSLTNKFNKTQSKYYYNNKFLKEYNNKY